MVLEAYIPFLFEQLGIFIPLIVVNCLILGRAEAFASKNHLWSSIVDALGMGIGFTIALTLLGAVREILGSGSLFDFRFVSEDANTLLLFILPPGAFIALAYLSVLFKKVSKTN
jgi:electron transport complex protein RnfE